MNDVVIGVGNLTGKGVYANRDFKNGEVVIRYHLKPLTKTEFEELPDDEKIFTHRDIAMGEMITTDASLDDMS